MRVNSELTGITSNDIINKLTDANIECRPLWKPLHLQPVYKGSAYYGNGFAEKIFKNGLCLPSGTTLLDEDIIKISNIILELFQN